MLGHEQTREALPKNIVREEGEENKPLCVAQSIEGEIMHLTNTPAPLKELKHSWKCPCFKSTPLSMVCTVLSMKARFGIVRAMRNIGAQAQTMVG